MDQVQVQKIIVMRLRRKAEVRKIITAIPKEELAPYFHG